MIASVLGGRGLGEGLAPASVVPGAGVLSEEQAHPVPGRGGQRWNGIAAGGAQALVTRRVARIGVAFVLGRCLGGCGCVKEWSGVIHSAKITEPGCALSEAELHTLMRVKSCTQ